MLRHVSPVFNPCDWACSYFMIDWIRSNIIELIYMYNIFVDNVGSGKNMLVEKNEMFFKLSNNNMTDDILLTILSRE